MVIQVERLFLYEALIPDPFIFVKTDGIDVTMSETNDRVIEFLDIDKAVFLIDIVLKGGITATLNYGGEDHLPSSANAKLSSEFSIEFNMPIDDPKLIAQLLGLEFSMVGMRRDLTFFAIFGRFTAQVLNIDNDVLQRVTLTTNRENHIIYDVNNLNVTEVINIIGTQPPVFPPFIEVDGFDYPLEAVMN